MLVIGLFAVYNGAAAHAVLQSGVCVWAENSLIALRRPLDLIVSQVTSWPSLTPVFAGNNSHSMTMMNL
jgi:hypothetical protein